MSTESIWYSEKLPDIAELQDRLSGPISTLLLGFLAVPLAKISPRSGIYGSMVIAFAIYFSYSNMQRVNHSWVISGKIPEWLGYFWHDGLLFLVAIILLIRWYGFKWIINSLKGTH